MAAIGQKKLKQPTRGFKATRAETRNRILSLALHTKFEFFGYISFINLTFRPKYYCSSNFDSQTHADKAHADTTIFVIHIIVWEDALKECVGLKTHV